MVSGHHDEQREKSGSEPGWDDTRRKSVAEENRHWAEAISLASLLTVTAMVYDLPM
jgi:hypothetical protein